MNKIPITIGVVGHINAIVTDKHKEVIRKLFTHISDEYKNSPIALFSQLAVGADTEVAKLFLEVGNDKKVKRDFRLIASITYDKEYFINTQFKTNEHKKEFNKLWEDSKLKYEINKLSDQVKKEIKNGDSDSCELKEYYKKGGEFVADSAIILIALNKVEKNADKDENNSKSDLKCPEILGGTENIISYKKTGAYKNIISEHIFDEIGQLIEISIDRKLPDGTSPLEENPAEELLDENSYKMLFKELLKDVSIKKALDKIESLNETIDNINTNDTHLVRDSANYLYPQEKELSSNNSTLRSYFAIVDVMTNKHQFKYKLILTGLFILGFVIFGFFESYKHLGLHAELFFSTLALLAFAFGIFKLSFDWKNHEKYIENRVLAEALRIQFYWSISGIKKAVSKYILHIHKKEYQWLKHVLLAMYGLTYFQNKSPKNESISDIKKYWIEDQKRFFDDKVEILEKKEKHHHIFSIVTFVVGILLLVGVFYLNYLDHHHKWLHPLIVLDSVVFGVFALVKTYYEKRGYEQIKTQYSLMKNIYNKSSDKLSEINSLLDSTDLEDTKQVLFLTGKEAVVENGNWYMVFKDKKPEVEGIG